MHRAHPEGVFNVDLRFKSLAALSVVASLACAEAGSDAWSGTVTDSAGVTIVDNPERGLWPDVAPWSFVEEFRVGGMDAPVESQFGLVPGLDVDDQGRLYVLDMQAAQVSAFGPEGTWLRTFGGPGGGPGELSAQTTGVFVVGDELWVADLGNQRVTRWGLDGSDRPAIALSLTRGIPLRWDRLGDDRVVAQLRAMQGMGMQGDTTGDAIVTVGDSAPATIATLPQGASFSMEGGAARFRFFDREPLWDAAEDGRLLSASNDRFRIEVRDAGGALVQVLSKDFTPRPVTEADATRMLRSIREMMAAQGAPPAAVDQLLQGASFADNYPAMAQILAGPGGSVWVQRIQTPDQVAESDEINLQDLGSDDWDVFDSDGRYLGVLTLPAKFTPLKIDGTAVWGVQRDELDVPSVVRFRVDGM